MEETKMSEVMEEIRNASEEDLRRVVEHWFKQTRTSGMKIGAGFISAAVYDAIEKNLKKNSKPSLNDYRRAVKRIIEIVSVQLKPQETVQNDLEEEANDRTAE